MVALIMNTSLTILTPTYNRANWLERLYRSLVAQTRRDFEWLVVDDGSTDHTPQLIASLKAENTITIRYIRKDNGGKHTAVNAGVALIESPLTFIVDSDDYLTANAVERALDVWGQHASPRLSGLCFLRGTSPDHPLGRTFASHCSVASYIDMRFNRGISGDKAEIYKTDVLKAYPFPEFAGERFLAEDAVWARIGLLYEMVHINEIIYISNYLEGGLTLGDQSINVRCANGSVESTRWFLSRKVRLKVRLPMAWRYVAYGLFAKKPLRELLRMTESPLLVLTQLPAGVALYMYWSRKFAPQLARARTLNGPPPRAQINSDAS
ncbi:glycosyltransferase involved in cell wall biosynthesis [Paraburkholderia sp. GAS199]|uniref:glycosyltransferase family 2 protein n=1 Tax=Paraburkholderia sp. GAS199 TaxID=3035126 RepID=UPI003D1D1D20